MESDDDVGDDVDEDDEVTDCVDTRRFFGFGWNTTIVFVVMKEEDYSRLTVQY